MKDQEKPRFIQMLTKAMSAYGKPLPDGHMVDAWWEILNGYPLRAVSMSFAAYCDENDKFVPVPAGIAMRCKTMDGRPSAEEAWAIALMSRDEADTVVWTTECAEAYSICSSVFPDEVGARMAFREAYNRLVSEARTSGRPANWNASLGWDPRKREAAISRASVAGLLPAPVVHALLPNYSDTATPDEKSPAGLLRLKEEMAKLQEKRIEEAERFAAESLAERQAEAAKKRAIADRVEAYQADNEMH